MGTPFPVPIPRVRFWGVVDDDEAVELFVRRDDAEERSLRPWPVWRLVEGGDAEHVAET